MRWSVFRIPLTKQFGWSISQVTLTFTLAILMLGFSAFVGDLWMRRAGPRTVAIAAGIFYGAGVFLASISDHHLWWLYFSYGVLGGIGLGLGYIVPVATLVKWFPDRRGMITGLMFLVQALVFWLMPRVHSFPAFTSMAFIVLLCYGGGFGTMPAFAADYFGAENVGSIYGLMLTAWGFAGVFGPLLIAYIRQNTGHYTEALYVLAGVVLVSSVIPLIVRPPATAMAVVEERRPKAA